MTENKLKFQKKQITKLTDTQKKYIKGGDPVSTNCGGGSTGHTCTETQGNTEPDRICLLYSVIKW